MKRKIKLLSEYYRFHNEIPRLFMLSTSDVMNKYNIHTLYTYINYRYHDKKRRIDYYRISRAIEDENKRNPDRPPKGIVGDKPEVNMDTEEYEET